MYNRLKYSCTNICLVLISFIIISGCSQSAVIKTEKTNHGLLITLDKGEIELQVISDRIIHVQSWMEKPLKLHPSLSVIDTVYPIIPLKMQENEDSIIISTAQMKVICQKKTGKLSFQNKNGEGLLKESERIIKPAKVTGESTFNIEQKFQLDSEEAIYGLGQHQAGNMNLRGTSLTMAQFCMEVNVPVVLSTKNYAVLWDNPSLTRFSESNNIMDLWSEVGDGLNYYFIAGNNMDEVVSGYRGLTGKAPMFGKWAYGLFQSKEHYNTQHEVDSVLQGFRQRHIPLDVIVQDWYYWNPQPWGSHYFDCRRYPDPVRMIENVHKNHAKFMISVWGRFDKGSPNQKELEVNGYLYPTIFCYGVPLQYYDAYNPAARKMYWKQVNDSLFKKGVDAWWQDATEPEIGNLTLDSVKENMNNALGTGARYLNSYPLMTTEAFYKNQREETSDKRVCILTRSAFAGQQRNAAITWSGDIKATWQVFRNQIPAGLNFCYTGIPYWTTDIGAFIVEYANGNKNNSYKELFVRWFQYGSFCPIFRVHGSSTPREMWCFGEPGTWAYDALFKADQLRYRLMPYIYSLAWKITNENYTVMRGLAFDFPKDKNVFNIKDQFMYGSFLVNPVTDPMYFDDELEIGKVIPSRNFFDKNNKQGGLSGEYYNGEKFDNLKKNRTDSIIDFNWGQNSPMPELQHDNYTIRWSGKIEVPSTGDYTFVVSSDDGSSLWVDNKLIINDWKQHATETHTGTIHLEANKKYAMKLEYLEIIGGANISLKWIVPEVSKKETKKERQVYLPAGNSWYNFWTGEKSEGGKNIAAKATIDIIPLFVKAGSIIPTGPFIEYATEKPADPLELRIYPGADGTFTLYEDENDNYNYEKGQYATIDFVWKDKEKRLIMKDRIGSYPGMLKSRKINVVLVSEKHGAGIGIIEKPDKSVVYFGKAMSLVFN
jgi:alpha-D-xyloside xylohydrolase